MHLRILVLMLTLSFSSWAQNKKFEVEKTLSGHGSPIELMVFSPNGKELLTGDFSGKIFFWDISSGQKVRQMDAHGGRVVHISFSNDGKTICTSGDDGRVKVWDYASLALQHTIVSPHAPAGNPNFVYFAYISSDNKYVYFGGTNCSIHKATLGSKSPPTMVYKNNHYITNAILSSDKSYLIFSSGYSIKFMQMTTGKIIKEIGACQNYINMVLVAPNIKDRLISWCEDGSINFWDSQSGTLVGSIKAGTEGYSRLAISPDGDYLITGNSKSSAKIWNLNTQKMVAELKGHDRTVIDFKFTPTGENILTCSHDATVKYWKIPDAFKPKTTIDFVDPTAIPEHNLPKLLKGRPVFKEKDYVVSKRTITLLVWDNEEVDGDIISVNVNGTWVLENHTITEKKKEILITLNDGESNYIILHAENLGKVPPNTATFSFYDGVKNQVITLNSDLSSSTGIHIVHRR